MPVAAGLDVALDEADAAAALVATIPAHRRDLVVEADLAEEVARVRGYETIAGQLPATAMPPYRPDPRRGVDRVRDLLAGRGLTEVVTHALIGPDDHARLGLATRRSGHHPRRQSHLGRPQPAATVDAAGADSA